MFELNLFHEQQQLQHERDFDPVRLTILGGVLVLSGLICWYAMVYLSMSGLRKEIADKKAKLKKLDDELKGMGTLTDLGKIQQQALSIEDRIQCRVLLANQLDLLRDIIPTNCQVRTLRTVRTIGTLETLVPPGPNARSKAPVVVKKRSPMLDLLLEIETHGKTKVDVLQTRDNLLESLCKEPRLTNSIKQVMNEDTHTNQNDVTVMPGTVQDPKGGEQAKGIFEFRLPFALKDKPKDI